MHATLREGLETLKTLIAFPSVQGDPEKGAPFGKSNGDALRFILHTLEKEGFRTVDLDGYCGYAEIGEGELFGILGHLDVVPISGDWKYPPFSATIADGYLWGRGTQDDKGPMVAAVYAAIRALREGLHPTKRLRFIFGCNEESGWRCMEYYREHEEMPVMGFSPDSDFPVINCEKGVVYHTIKIPKPSWLLRLNAGIRPNMVPDTAEITVEEDSDAFRSLSRVFTPEGATFHVTGVSAHGSTPEKGDNALIKLLERLPDKNLNALWRAFRFQNGIGCNLSLWDKQSGSLTLNLGTARTEGDSLVFELDIRYPISYSKEEITAILTKSLQRFAVIKRGAYHDPLYVPPDHPLVKTLLSAYETVVGKKLKPLTVGGATYARFLPLGVAFGPIFPGEESTIHQANERISLENYEKMSEIYYQAIKKLCF